MICERCHAGQMREYEKKIGLNKTATIGGTRCAVCGFTLLANDYGIRSAVCL